MQHQPRSKRGNLTREAILKNAALEFTAQGFHATSVAEVCRRAGIANGSFYQYFDKKQDVFDSIVASAREAFYQSVKGRRNLPSLCNGIFDYFHEYGSLFQVFREAEFNWGSRFSISFYQPVIDEIKENTSLNEAQTWAFLGAICFLGLHYGIWPGKSVATKTRKSFLEIAEKGIAAQNRQCWRQLKWPSLNIAKIPNEQREVHKTKRLLLNTARNLFSTKGYGRCKVSEITAKAEVALGTFYVHFQSKYEILEEVVREIKEDFLAHTSLVADCGLSRVEKERNFLLAFLYALESRADSYRIVREAEFAEASIGRGYYESIAKDYALSIEETRDRDQSLIAEDPRILAWVIMGTAHFTGMRWILWNEREQPKPDLSAIASTLKWLFCGISPP